MPAACEPDSPGAGHATVAELAALPVASVSEPFGQELQERPQGGLNISGHQSAVGWLSFPNISSDKPVIDGVSSQRGQEPSQEATGASPEKAKTLHVTIPKDCCSALLRHSTGIVCVAFEHIGVEIRGTLACRCMANTLP
jgi:hypothetical protein